MLNSRIDRSSVNIINKVKSGKKVSINEIDTAKLDVQSKMNDKNVQQKIQEAQNMNKSM